VVARGVTGELSHRHHERMIEEPLGDPEGVLVLPDGEPRAAFLVLGGSSGRVESERARVLASHGVAALAMKWFGGRRQPETPREVPLESFLPALDRLAALSGRLGVLGTSFGAEAGLQLALLDSRIDVVAALAPTSVVWGTPDLDAAGRPIPASKWTWRGAPVPFVPYLDQSTWDGPEFRTARQIHEASIRAHAARVPDATITVEQIRADVLLAAGGDDEVWQAVSFAEEIRRRRADAGLRTVVVQDAEAGHRAILPAENPPPLRPELPRGGHPDADRAHGQRVLAALLTMLPVLPCHERLC
jgi:uncharacterized protein